MTKNNVAKNGNGASHGFESGLFKAAGKRCGNIKTSDSKLVAHELIFFSTSPTL